jgi:dolichyl-phosphate-mannose-protein mannosyltransferase
LAREISQERLRLDQVMISPTTSTGSTETVCFPIGPNGAKPVERIEKLVAVGFFIILLVLRWFYATNQPWDSDEPQHLHVVWGWANGMLPYKDIFDNHAPLLQAISAPVFALFGESPDIVTKMRWAIMPFSVLVLVMTYLIGLQLFSRRIALWGAVLAAAFPDLYSKLGEYRPDVFWCAAWLVLLWILVSGELTARRLFWAGFVLGVSFAASMKTSFLLLTLLLGAATVWLLRTAKPELRAQQGSSAWFLIAPVLGTLIVPLTLVAFFSWKGSLAQMYYCVITHNLAAGGDRWALLLRRIPDVRFWLFLPAIAAGIWLMKRDKDQQRGLRRFFFMSVTGLYCPLLFSIWPLISKQDFVPFFPILILVLTCPLVSIGESIGTKTLLPAFLIPAAVAAAELTWMMSTRSPFKAANQTNFAIISDTLKLTHPGETVLDAKGQAIFRPRPFYYVFEQITREMVERGQLRDDAAERLAANRTPVVVASHWLSSPTGQFVSQNYVPVGSVLVLGKKLFPGKDGHVEFEVVIPAKYAIIGANGLLSGNLDGTELNGSRDLSPGTHELDLALPAEPVFAVWSRAIEKGFSPFSHTR